MRLYHFLRTEYALDDLRNRRLKIAEYSDLNDPFELIAAHSRDSVQRQILKKWKRVFQQKWGILCFCKTWRNPVMWSHYAEKHSGVCLGFEVDDEYAIPVKYSKNRLKLDFVGPSAEQNLNEKTMLRLLSTKYSDWGYEREVRVSVGLRQKDSGTGLYYYKFDEKVRLSEVIAGPLCEVSLTDVENALSEMDSQVEIFKTRLAFQSFRVVRDKRGFEGAIDA